MVVMMGGLGSVCWIMRERETEVKGGGRERDCQCGFI